MFNPSLTGSFFGLRPILPGIPHVRGNMLGLTTFTPEVCQKLTKAAEKTGIATYWAGPMPMIYVTSNQVRRALVREAHIGSCDQQSAELLKTIVGNNNVMCHFPSFMNIQSDTYLMQRKFLFSRFTIKSRERLAGIASEVDAFLKEATKKDVNSCNLREFVTELILHTSSHLLGLTDCTLDKIYLDNPGYRETIVKVAHYGISESYDPEFEKKLEQIFLDIFEKNFTSITNGTVDNNLIRNIFASMALDFPKTFKDFFLLPKETQHVIAMNFAATGLGGLFHSTTNTLDLALARLLKNPAKLAELTKLMASHKDIDISSEAAYDKTGPFFPIAEWVLHNVFLYPPFSHSFYLNRESFTVTLDNGTEIVIPSMSFTVVNYIECNRSNEKLISEETFSDNLKSKFTTGDFIHNPQVASFGGSKIDSHNNHSRSCPGAKTSLYEQMIIIVLLLRDYNLTSDDSEEISCEIDPSQHPICSRVRVGTIALKKLTEPFEEESSSVKSSPNM